jgi:ribonuclease T1
VFLSCLFRAPQKRLASVIGSLMAVCVVSVCLLTSTSWARDAEATSSVIALKQLPPEARQTHVLIHSGGPFPFRKDGTVFGNRERLLPARARGFYREYTVATPGSHDRGARRIVCGGKQRQAPDNCFYSADHYASFSLIVQ